MNLVCFSHLSWNFVYQRPQHLISRFVTSYKVFFVQEFSYSDQEDGYTIQSSPEGVWIVLPNLKHDVGGDLQVRQRALMDLIFASENIRADVFWYYTPLSLLFSDHLRPSVIVYDCMDELSAFKFADSRLKEAEDLLFQKATLVFTGGNSLYASKKGRHPHVYLFPSSIDKAHFGRARNQLDEPADQASIPYPRLGFFGVVDERFDIELIEQSAALKPDWHFIIIGPVVKIDPASLPYKENIHYLGSKSYQELPLYLSGWDIALIPFAINESTRFISPTKTPEYLAAGKPVISTPITDVIDPYGKEGLVKIVSNASELVMKAAAMLNNPDWKLWLEKVDEALESNSWDITWKRMDELIKKDLVKKQHLKLEKKETYV